MTCSGIVVNVTRTQPIDGARAPILTLAIWHVMRVSIFMRSIEWTFNVRRRYDEVNENEFLCC